MEFSVPTILINPALTLTALKSVPLHSVLSTLQLTTAPLPTNSILPFFMHPEDERLKIAHVRSLSAVTARSIPQNAYRVVVGSLTGAGAPAQNALLKFLEEVPRQTIVLLCCDSASACLPTIASRCQLRPITLTELGISTDSDPDLLTDVAKLYDLVQHDSITDCIAFAQSYTDRDRAQALIASALLEWNSYGSLKNPDVPLSFYKQLLHTHQELSHTINAQLSLEHCLFAGIQAARVLDES